MTSSPPARRIALVDDEDSLRETVSASLRREGYLVETYSDGLAAWSAFQSSLPDLFILDILMPRMDGLELCRRIRALSPSLPIIFLTSKDEEFDRVLGLELGADDYLCKPFSLRELAARVKVLFRRAALPATAGDQERVLEAGPLRLDLDRCSAEWKGVAVNLTVTEFRILSALARHPGHVKTRTQLLQEAYPDDTYVGERTIDSHIKRLRRRLGAADPAFDAIDTVHGMGYRFRAG